MKNEVVKNEITTKESEVLNAIESPQKESVPTLHEVVTLTNECIINAIELCNLERLRVLYQMVKVDKETFKIKERLSLRKLIRESIHLLAKDESKENLVVEISTKKASDKQNATSGFNKMIDIEKRSLGACLNVINSALTLAKDSPNKVYEFSNTTERYDELTGKVNKVTIEFSVKYHMVKHDIVKFARIDRDFYTEVLNLLQIANVGNLTEKKVNKFITDNLERLQDIKAEIKKAKASAKASK